MHLALHASPSSSRAHFAHLMAHRGVATSPSPAGRCPAAPIRRYTSSPRPPSPRPPRQPTSRHQRSARPPSGGSARSLARPPPHTGGRSLSQLPWPPERLLAPPTRRVVRVVVRHAPSPPAFLVRLVGLGDHRIIPRATRSRPRKPASWSRCRSLSSSRAVAFQLGGQLGGRHALGRPPQDQDQHAGPSAWHHGAGRVPVKAFEDAVAVAAAVSRETKEDGGGGGQPCRPSRWHRGQSEPIGMKPERTSLAYWASSSIQVSDREVHGRPRV